MIKRIAALAILATQLIPAAAFAGDATCVRRNLPAAEIARLDAAYGESLRTALDSEEVDVALLGAAVRACTRDGQVNNDAIFAYRAYELQLQSERWMLKQHGVTPERREAAWKQLRTADGDYVAKLGVDGDSDAAAREIQPMAEQFRSLVGLPDTEEGYGWAFAYVAGRFMRQVHEDRF